MKRYLLPILSALLLSLPMSAQKESVRFVGNKQLAKLFTEAFNAGRPASSFYRVDYTKDKPIHESDLKQFCTENNLALGSYAMRTIQRFGDEDETIKYVEFLPNNEHPVYLMSYIGEKKALKMSDMKTAKARYYIDINGEILHEASVIWSGDVIDGCADGMGTAAFYQNDFRGYMFMEGKFQKGMPVGDMKYYIYRGGLFFDERQLIDYDLFVAPMICEGMRSYKQPHTGDQHFGFVTIHQSHGDWGFLDADGNVALSARYKSVVSEFKNGKAAVCNNDREFYIDKTGNNLGDTEAQQKRDHDNDLALVKRTANLVLPDSYMRKNGLWDSVVTGNDYSMDRSDYDQCNKALSLIEKYDTPEFNQYWDKIYDIYLRVIELFNRDVEESNALNRGARDTRERQQAREEAQKRANIGVESMKWPDEKGKTDMFSSIDDGDYDLNGGQIELTNGKSFEWYIVYHRDKIYAYRYWKGLTTKSDEFATYEEMVEDMKRQ